MEKKFVNILLKIFLGVFALIFTLIFARTLFNGGNLGLDYKVVWVIISTIIWLGVLGGISLFIFSRKEITKKKEVTILAIVFTVAFVVQVIVGRILETGPVFDFGAVFNGAGEWTLNGNFEGYLDYFTKYFNNRGILLFLHLIFSGANFIGISDFYLVGTIINILFIDLTFLLVYLICRKQFGTKSARISLAVCFMCIPMYFFTPIFYTDTLSMLFIALTYYLYLSGKNKDMEYRINYYIFMGISCAIGIMIKSSVAIVLIAIVIDVLISSKIIGQLFPLFVCLLIAFFFNFLVSEYFSAYMIREDLESKQGISLSYWIMMGLNEGSTGRYNNEDDGFIMSFENLEARDAAAKEEIKKRYNELGFKNYMAFLYSKSVVNFGQGDFGIYHYLDDNPKNDTILHEFGTWGGKYFSAFRHISEGYHIALFLLIIASSVIMILNKNNEKVNLISYISIFGLFLFLCFWEANPRLIFNYFSMFAVAAVPAINMVCDKVMVKIGKQDRSTKQNTEPVAEPIAESFPESFVNPFDGLIADPVTEQVTNQNGQRPFVEQTASPVTESFAEQVPKKPVQESYTDADPFAELFKEFNTNVSNDTPPKAAKIQETPKSNSSKNLGVDDVDDVLAMLDDVIKGMKSDNSQMSNWDDLDL